MLNRNALIILNAIPGLSNKNIVKLIAHFGSAQTVLDATAGALEESGCVTPLIAKRIKSFAGDDFLNREFKVLNQDNISIITYQDDEYPEQLKSIADAPVVLYVKGMLPAHLEASLAIVGSRMASIYGHKVAESFAMQFVQYGLPIISGLAKGIDAAAHRGAIKGQGQTVAVLGCGLGHVYPSQNKELYDQIPQYGAIISEFPYFLRPAAYNFPRRNRIVSGLSQAVLVVEAAQRSGALITADFALEQGRDVYAVPGNIDNLGAGGTNSLIAQGAKMVSCIDDILEDFRAFLPEQLQVTHTLNQAVDREKITNNLTEEEKFVYNHITADPIHIDELLNNMKECQGISANSILLKLEIQKLIEQLPGKLFRKTASIHRNMKE